MTQEIQLGDYICAVRRDLQRRLAGVRKHQRAGPYATQGPALKVLLPVVGIELRCR